MTSSNGHAAVISERVCARPPGGFTLAGQSMSVTWDAASRISAQTYFPAPAQANTYGYDALDRLTSAVMPSTSQSFGYDANGNRTSKTVGAGNWTYAYPATSNRLSGITSGGTVNYVHDANGSITSDGINTFGYDTRGRLVSALTALGSATYQVNALGQRYAKTLQGTTTVFLYDSAGRLIAETSDAGATYTEYVWLADTPVAVIKPGTPTPSRYYIHSDHLDTPRVITDANQAIRWRWDNDDPFGANVANQNPSGLGSFAFNLRFPGQYFDAETGYHYNYFRDYSPEIGRYIESDPIGLAGGTNTYTYVRANPIVLTDPTGEVPPALLLVPLFVGGVGAGYYGVDQVENYFEWDWNYDRTRKTRELADLVHKICEQDPFSPACKYRDEAERQWYRCVTESARSGKDIPHPPLPRSPARRVIPK